MFVKTGKTRKATCDLCEAPNLVEEIAEAGLNTFGLLEGHFAHCGLPCLGGPMPEGAPSKYAHGRQGYCRKCGVVKAKVR